MANFRTHAAAGTFVAGTLATLTMAAAVVTPQEIITLALAGALGSVLPDIDLKDSRSSQILFFGLAIFLTSIVLFSFASEYSIAEMWILCAATFVCVRFFGHNLFHSYAVHRGIWHSLLAGAFFASLTAVIGYYVLGLYPAMAWLAGGFMFVGYVTHLVLDEIYSVEFGDTRIKRSFGTALKLFDGSTYRASALMAALTAGLIYLAPTPMTLTNALASHALWAQLRERLLPQGPWFGVEIDERGFARRVPSVPAMPVDETVTGSIEAGTARRAPDAPQ